MIMGHSRGNVDDPFVDKTQEVITRCKISAAEREMTLTAILPHVSQQSQLHSVVSTIKHGYSELASSLYQ